MHLVHEHNAAVTPSRKIPSRKSHVRWFSQNWVRCGSLSWQLRGLCSFYMDYIRGCYRVCVPLVFANLDCLDFTGLIYVRSMAFFHTIFIMLPFSCLAPRTFGALSYATYFQLSHCSPSIFAELALSSGENHALQSFRIFSTIASSLIPYSIHLQIPLLIMLWSMHIHSSNSFYRSLICPPSNSP